MLKEIFTAALLATSLIVTPQGIAVGVGHPGAYPDGTHPKDKSSGKPPVAYTYLREADVCWEKRIWRAIDLREKANLGLYYPTLPSSNRTSLLQMMTRLLLSGQLPAFRDEEFTVPLEISEIREKLVLMGDTQEVEYYRPDGSSYFKREPGFVDSTWAFRNFAELQVKEDWFLDRQRSVLEVRILSLGFCCLLKDKEDLGPVPLFYVYFPACRPYFAACQVFNPRNDGDRLSFDDVFAKRMFSSRIVKESNVYDDRDIESYTRGAESLLESDRIKMQIFLFEHDLWQF